MGKMKELFIEQQDELMYRGSQDPRIIALFRPDVESTFVKVDNHPCPNCNLPTSDPDVTSPATTFMLPKD
jgi:hypothetical protein